MIYIKGAHLYIKTGCEQAYFYKSFATLIQIDYPAYHWEYQNTKGLGRQGEEVDVHSLQIFHI